MFKLEDYDTVEMLNAWFQENYPMGRLCAAEIAYHDPEKGFITVVAKVWRDANDPFPAVTNIGNGIRDLMPAHMRRWYAEDTATSALGRAISLLKGGKTATRDSMQQVMQAATPPTSLDSDPWATVTVTSEPALEPLATGLSLIQGALGGTITETAQTCSHGRMTWKEGISSKTGNKYKGWVCPSQTKPNCPPKWEKD
jgi:hypothetical protein